MRDDQPTLPNLPPSDPGAAPTWPGSIERPHPSGSGEPRTQGAAGRVLLGVSLGANAVLLLAVLGLLLLGRAGWFAPGAPASAATTPGISTTGSTLGTPTATVSPLPQATWLQVSPSSITLGCDGDTRTQLVMLTNSGPQPVQWQANLSFSQDQAGVTITPNQGQLDAGASMPLQVQNQTRKHGDQGGADQQGIIRFTTDPAATGTAPSVSYTTTGCQ